MNGPTPDHLLRSLSRDLPIESVWSTFRDHADPSALRAVLDRLGPRLVERCRLITSDRQLAEDALQEALTRLFSARHLLRTYPEAVAWLYRAATNAAKQIARGRRRSTFREKAVGGGRPERTADTTDTVIDLELAAMLAQAVIDLPENERRAIELVYFERMTHTDAAAALGWSRGSVGTYVTRGLRRLRGGLSRRGVAAVAVPVVEAALGAAPPLQASDWIGVLPRVWAADAVPVAPVIGGLMVTKLRWVIGLAAVVVIGVSSGIWWGQSGQKADPPQQVQAAAETLAAKNDRLFRRDVLPELIAELKRMLPPDNPPRLIDVTTTGPIIECEFATAKPLLGTKSSRLRVRYCILRRQMDATVDIHGDGTWKTVDPKRPLILEFDNLGLKFLNFDTGHDRLAHGHQAFDKLPTDERAGAELVQLTFGEPGQDLLWPPEVRAATGDGERLIVTTPDSTLFDWDGREWRYQGVCDGWFLTAVGDRLYCDRDGLWTRPIRHADPKWEKVCGRPPEDWKKFRVHGMAVAGGRVHYAVHRHPDGATAVWSKSLTDPKAEWARNELPVHPGLFTGTGDWLYAADGANRLTRRSATDATAKWEVIGRLPADVGVIQAVGDRLLAFDRAKGPIHARSLADSDDKWTEIGRVRDQQR